MTLGQGQTIISTSVNSFGNIDYNTGAHGSLKFESSFGPPVTLSSGPALSGADKGYNWASIGSQYWDMEFGTPIDAIDTFPSGTYPTYGPTSPPHGSSATRAFLIGTTTTDDRNQMDFYMNDGTPPTSGSGSGDLGGMNGQFYESVWFYLPTDFTLNPLKLPWGQVKASNGYYSSTGYWDWLNVWSYRESDPSITNENETSIALDLQVNSTRVIYWNLDERAYIGMGAGFMWDDLYASYAPVPLGQWDHLEIYINRSSVDPVIDIWCNGNAIYSLNKNNMYTLHDQAGSANSPAYNYTDPFNPAPFTSRGYPKFYIKNLCFYGGEGSLNPPQYYWVTDFQIWNGLPA